MGMKVSGTPRRVGGGGGGRKKRDEAEQDGLSGDRLTEVMRGEDEREEHDGGIQMERRLTPPRFQLLIQHPADAHRCIPLSSAPPSFCPTPRPQSNFLLPSVSLWMCQFWKDYGFAAAVLRFLFKWRWWRSVRCKKKKKRKTEVGFALTPATWNFYSGVTLDSRDLDVNVGLFQVLPVWVEWRAESRFNSVTSWWRRGINLKKKTHQKSLDAILSSLKWVKVSDTRLYEVKPAFASLSVINNLVNPDFPSSQFILLPLNFRQNIEKLIAHFFLMPFHPSSRRADCRTCWQFKREIALIRFIPCRPFGPWHDRSWVGRSWNHGLAVANCWPSEFWLHTWMAMNSKGATFENKHRNVLLTALWEGKLRSPIFLCALLIEPTIGVLNKLSCPVNSESSESLSKSEAYNIITFQLH